MKRLQRICTAAVYLIPGAATLHVLLRAALRKGLALRRITESSEHHMGQLPIVCLVCLLAASGLYCVVRPSTMVGWVQKVYTETPPEKSALAFLIVRVIGAAWIAFAVVILYVVVLK
jgi:hypothetical protein